MSDGTSIEWTDTTWSPLRARRRDTGKVGQHCERVSAGCLHCYAARHNGRNLPNGGTGLGYVRKSRDLVETFIDERVLSQPLRWRAPRKVFVCNQTDLFADFYTDEQILEVLTIMGCEPARKHTFQILTKRPKRMRDFFLAWKSGDLPGVACGDEQRSMTDDWKWPFRNVWLGVSVEDQATADARIPILLDTPAAVRFVSAEPLLGPVDLRIPSRLEQQGLPWPQCAVLDWVIVGGESGPGARVCHVDWIRSIVGQCRAAGVACFVKQLGAEPHADKPPAVRHPDGPQTYAIYAGKDPKGGDPDGWPEDLRVREFPQAPAAAPLRALKAER